MHIEQKPNYSELRKILKADIGKELADKFTDEEIKAIGKFLLNVTRGCYF